MKQTLTQRIDKLEKQYTAHIKAEHIGYDPKSFTATRSTGATGEPPYGTYPIKPQEDVTYTKEAMEIQKLLWNTFYAVITKEQAMEISDKILAIVKGE